MDIKTNNQPRPILLWVELSDAEQAEFDYLTEDDAAGSDFVRYRGTVYHLGDFMRSPLDGWDGYHSDSAFSAILCRYVDDGEAVVMGLAYS